MTNRAFLFFLILIAVLFNGWWSLMIRYGQMLQPNWVEKIGDEILVILAAFTLAQVSADPRKKDMLGFLLLSAGAGSVFAGAPKLYGFALFSPASVATGLVVGALVGLILHLTYEPETGMQKTAVFLYFMGIWTIASLAYHAVIGFAAAFVFTALAAVGLAIDLALVMPVLAFLGRRFLPPMKAGEK